MVGNRLVINCYARNLFEFRFGSKNPFCATRLLSSDRLRASLNSLFTEAGLSSSYYVDLSHDLREFFALMAKSPKKTPI